MNLASVGGSSRSMESDELHAKASPSALLQATRAGSWLLIASLVLLLVGGVAMAGELPGRDRLLWFGIGLLVVTPIVNVGGITWLFWRQGDRVFAVVGLAMLVGFGGALFLGMWQSWH